ncbi:MAG TPA: hypothetical protein VH572_08710 [Gaiella sp.]|jgi:hypothetical protein
MRSRTVFLIAALAAALAAGDASAGKGGPSPGVLLGWDGARAPGAAVRYVALFAPGNTVVAAVRVRDGRVLRHASLRGELGVPQVAFDGSTDGLTADGRTLVLASPTTSSGRGATSRFAVLSTRSLHVRQTIDLPGLWSFDAVSPDGSRIYAIEYLGGGDAPAYRVRAIDVASGRPLPGAVIDPREPEEVEMRGSPTTRAFGPGRAWAFTLYAKPNGTAFVHALDTRRGKAVCIDLPWTSLGNAIWAVRMSVTDGGRALTLRQRGGGRLASVDLGSFRVRAFRAPTA